MKRKIRSKMVILLLILLTNIILTGCTSENKVSNALKVLFIKGENGNNNVIVKRNGEHITLENMLDTNVYVDYEIYLYDNKKGILYEKKYEKIF